MMMAMKVAVAFQTICHTKGMSDQWMTPLTRATAAPTQALQPMPSPLGCQITRTSVSRKMMKAASTIRSCQVVAAVRGQQVLTGAHTLPPQQFSVRNPTTSFMAVKLAE